ncbi:cytochrome P450 [Schizothecium vesticola]|uniref:Cytochrome P450 n=1 Tax=Schizothecium vesticola TaxID=314040 RepID=A0AA40EPM2_9PEZI|nr:cytochrome P450 [Schizothecium vesticola]
MGLTIAHLLDRGWGSDWTGAATVIAGVVSTLWLLLYGLQRVKKHRDEPPIIASAIPYVGHLLGMALFGGRYIKNIGLRNRSTPIFTLPVPFSRIYVVTDPSLAAAAQRASKTLSFSPLVPDLTRRILGFSPASTAIIAQHLDPTDSSAPRGLMADLHDMVYAHLGPGDALSSLTKLAVRDLAAHVNAYAAAHDRDPETVPDLLVWLRGFVAQSTASYLYGPENPLAQDPELEAAFWDFDHGIGGLLVGVWPAMTARKAYAGRERLVEAFAKYLEAGHHLGPGASDIVRRRVEILTAHGLPMAEAARSEVSFLFAGIVNTATTAFWVVVHLFARPALLRRVRAELLAGGVTELDFGGGKPTRLLDLESVKAGRASPTLGAVFREALRTGSDNYSTRLVKEDTVLAGRWWVGKGAVVQVAGGVIHADEGVWGEGAGEFDPVRFLKLEEGEGESGSGSGKGGEEKQKKVHPAAFRAFGGGKTLCPGRHFATYEIVAFAAMIVLTFDLEAVDGKGKPGGKIVVPAKEDGVLPVHILEPKTPVRVKVRVREDGGEIVVV